MGKHTKHMSPGRTTGVYLSGLVICCASAFFLMSQVVSPLINDPVNVPSVPPPTGETPTTVIPQVSGVPPVIDLVPRAQVRGGLTPTPSPIAPQEPTQGAPSSPVTTSTTPPGTTTRPPPVKPPVTTSAPKPPVVVKPPVLPPIELPNPQPLCKGLNVLPQVSHACNDILGNVIGALTEVSAAGGRGARPDNPTSCHPKGLALDLIVRNRLTGDLIATYARLNKSRLGITTILWRVPDHFDHVHLSFAPCTK